MNDSTPVAEHHYIIIAGTPKAGTTSLFKWLTDHPDTCASNYKETRFFLDEDDPLFSPKRFNGTNLNEYSDFFTQCNSDKNTFRVEASPNYLYSNTSTKIASLLPNSHIIFILRDPIDRLTSWYKYARQRGFISQQISFEEYVLKMVDIDKDVNSATPPHFQALEQCRYEKYLPAFRQSFGDRMITIDFREIKENPLGALKEICALCGLSPTYYENYTFRAENVSQNSYPTLSMKIYSKVRSLVKYYAYKYPRIMHICKGPNRILKHSLGIHINTKKAEEVYISAELSHIINESIKND